MSGGPGPRYWNEETQRWEDGDGTGMGSGTGSGSGAGTGSGTGSGLGDVAGAGVVSPEAPTAPVNPPPAPPSAPVPPSPLPPPRPDSMPEWWAAADAPSEARTPPTLPPGPGPWPAEASTWYGPSSTGAGGGTGAGGEAGAGTGAGADPGPGFWPSPEPLTGVGAPVPGRPRPAFSRRLVWSVVVGAAVVGVAVSLVLTLVVDSGDDDGKGGHTVAASSPTPGTPEPTDVSPSPSTDTASPSASTPELPAGYQSHEDPEGFRIAYPDGWTRSTVASSYGIDVVNYRSGDGEHRLQVYQVAEPSPAASFELYLSDQTPKPDGFHKLGLQTLDDGTFTGSRLEYTADSLKGEPDIGTWHVYDERFIASDGTIYAVAAYGPDADGREDELQLLATAVTWFCPQAGTCDDASVD